MARMAGDTSFVDACVSVIFLITMRLYSVSNSCGQICGVTITEYPTHTGGSLPDAIEFLDQAPAIESDKLVTLFDYWLGKIDGLTPPRKSDIDPLDIPKLLAHIWIQEHVPDTTEFRCRLAGEDVNARYPDSIVGRLFSEVIGETAWALVSEQYMHALEMPGIGHSIGPVYMHTIQRAGIGERLFLPLRDNDGRNHFILGATIYTPAADTTEEQQSITPRKTMTPLTALVN